MQLQLQRLKTVGLVLGLLGAAPAIAQTDKDLAAQIQELKKGQDQIRQQLQEIRTLLQQRQAPAAPAGPNVAGKIFDIGDNAVQGASSAKLTLVEFTDYQ